MGALTRLVSRNTQPAVIRAPRSSPRRLPPTHQPTATAGGSVLVYNGGRVAIPNSKVLRHWATNSEWIRGAINIRKSQVASAEWDIVPLDKNAPYSKRLQKRIRDKLRTPNPANDSWRSFMEPVVEDLITLDAGCVEKERNLLGEVVWLWPVDGATVRVNALWDGSDPSEARYYWYPDGFKELASWSNNDFIYMMANRRTDSPIGFSGLETLRMTIEAELNAHEYNRRMVENPAPDGLMNLGEGFNRQQVKEFESYFYSEVAGKGALAFVGGTKDPGFVKFRDSNRDMQFLEWQIYLVRKICVVMGLTPQDLGVTFDINRATAETQIQISEDRGLRPLMTLLQEYITQEIVWDQGYGGPANNLAFRFTSLNLRESTAKSKILADALSGVPWRTINEARVEEGREPIEGGDVLIMSTPTGAVSLEDVPSVREVLEIQQAAKAARAQSASS